MIVPMVELSPMTTISQITPDTSSTCLLENGITQRVQFYSDTLQDYMTATIYLPPCYDPGKSEGYPVIYLLSGQGMDDTFWPSIGVTDLATQMIRNGSSPFLMVFPYESNYLISVEDSPFGNAIIDDLIPWVDTNYNACQERQCREIGGISRGGGWAMHLALTNLDEFCAVGVHSFAYYSTDLDLSRTLAADPTTIFPQIYIDRGDTDYLAGSIDLFEQNLTLLGIDHVYQVNPGAHSDDYWQSQVGIYLAWYMQALGSNALQ
jgi:enterochelin esterase-like enzyme